MKNSAVFYILSRISIISLLISAATTLISSTKAVEEKALLPLPPPPHYIDEAVPARVEESEEPATPANGSGVDVSKVGEPQGPPRILPLTSEEWEDKPLSDDPDDLMLSPGEGVNLYISSEFPPLFSEGLSAYHRMDVEEARDKLVDYLVTDPGGEKMAEANFILGLILFKQSNFKMAKGFLQTAYKTLSNGGDYALYFLARCYEGVGDYGRASETWVELERRFPRSRFAVKALFRSGVNQYLSGDIDGGRLKLEKIIDERKGHALAPEVVHILFKIAVDEKDYTTAGGLYKELRINYSDSKAAQDILEDIKNLYKRKIKIPGLTYAERFKRIRNLHKNYMYRTARSEAEALEKELEKAPQQKALYSKLLLFLGEKLYRGKSGLSYLKKLLALEGAPNWVKGKAALAVAANEARWMDNRGAAEKYLAISEEYKGSSAGGEALYYAAWYLANSGNKAQGIKLFDEFLRRYPGHSRYAEGLWYGGWNNYRLGKYAEALKYFAKLAEKFAPNDIGQQGRYWEGRALQELGDKDGAREAFKKTISDYYLWFYTYQAELRLSELGDESLPLVAFKPATATAISVKDEPPEHVPKSLLFNLLNAEFLIALGFSVTAREEVAAIKEFPFGAQPEKVIKLARMYAGQDDYYDSFRIVREKFMSFYLAPPLSKEFSFYPEIWKLSYPLAYAKIMDVYARKYNLPPFLSYAIMREESHYRPNVVSITGARGLMQIMPGTGLQISRHLKTPFKKEMLFSPEKNIEFGCWYLKQLLDKFGGNPMLAAAGYNAGPGAVSRWLAGNGHLKADEFIEEISFRETRNYVKKVMKSLMVYKRLYDDDSALLPFPQNLSGEIKDNIDF
ncbi:MAG: tetratricopeptide repeat protein [Myxococcota bacterium]